MEVSSFEKYRAQGAYHYRHTLGARYAKDYDPRLSARYANAVDLLGPCPGDRILDAGSGEGVAAMLCCRRGARVSAVELDQEACRLGEEIRQLEGFTPEDLQFYQKNLYELPFSDGSFDGAISLEVIEHMEDVRAYLGEIHRVLRPGGKLVVSTPLSRADGKLQDPYHIREFTAKTLEEALSWHFVNIRVLSAWSGEVARAYENNQPFALFAKVRRRYQKYRGLRGNNLFARPVAFDPTCPLLLAVANADKGEP